MYERQLGGAIKEGKYIYLIEYDMIKDIQKKSKNPIEVMKSLINSGIVIETKIDLKSVGTLDENEPIKKIPFLVLFASIIEPDMMTVLVEIEENFIHSITGEMISELAEAANKPQGKKVQPPENVVNTSENESMGKKSPPVPQPKVEKKSFETPVKVKETKRTQESETLDVDKEEEQTADAKSTSGSVHQSSLRVNINLLDTLMTLAGELVLSRNQLLQSITAKNERAIETSSQRIDMITSELQEAIMRTRMQPISNVFNKFTRVVRDLANQLHKEVNLTMTG